MHIHARAFHGQATHSKGNHPGPSWPDMITELAPVRDVVRARLIVARRRIAGRSHNTARPWPVGRFR